MIKHASGKTPWDKRASGVPVTGLLELEIHERVPGLTDLTQIHVPGRGQHSYITKKYTKITKYY